jgi:hypothetical protein
LYFTYHAESVSRSEAEYVRDLGAAAWADEDGLLAMLRIYMDASGTHDGSPVVTVAAYVGKSKEWQNFTRRWKHANKPIEVFHAADCQALRGEFKGWTPEQRDEHVKRLLPILAQSELFGQAVGINMLDYDAAMFNRPDLKHMFGSPYATCFHWTVATIMDHVESAGTNDPYPRKCPEASFGFRCGPSNGGTGSPSRL